jgi:hypothetical protein
LGVLFGLFMAGAFVAVNYATVNMYSMFCFNLQNLQCTNGFVSQTCELTPIESHSYARASTLLLVLEMLDLLKHIGSEASDPREVEDSDPVGRDLLFAPFPSERVPPPSVFEGGFFLDF